jgi:very-short-patch-repair endonuclease
MGSLGKKWKLNKPRKPFSQSYKDKQRQIAFDRGYGKWMIGRTPWNKNKKGVQKKSEASKKAFSQYAKDHGFGKWMADRPCSPANKIKISKSMKTPQNLVIARRNGVNTSLKVREGKETDIERKTRLILEELKEPHKIQVPLFEITVADFELQNKKVIYVDGNHWHEDQPGKLRQDKGITKYLIKAGYKVLRIKGSEFKDIEKVKEKIITFIKT